MQIMKNLIKGLLKSGGNQLTASIRGILIDNYLRENLFENNKYFDPKRLSKYEYQVYSQHGEDGIIQEIFKRIGTTNKFFVEFGVEDGIENNTVFLLLKEWKGVWLEGGKKNIKSIQEKFGFLINTNKLIVKQAFITIENIERLFNSLGVPKEFDLLSIDIDGNDYWVWKAIDSYSPRVVVIEHNSVFRSDVEWIMSYNPNNIWNGSSYFGASLKSLEKLGNQKGYRLVGCDFTGVNAFFVRNDLVGDKFFEPFTAENHYEPPRYFLQNVNGHRKDFGVFKNAIS